MKEEENEGLSALAIILIVLIIVIIILIYVITIRYVDLSDKLEVKEIAIIVEKTNETEDRNEIETFNENEITEQEKEKTLSNLKYRFSRVKEIISKSEIANRKLITSFTFIYIAVKIVLVLLFIGIILTLYFAFGLQDPSQILTSIGVLTMLTVVASFLTFGTFNGASDFFNSLKSKLELKMLPKCIGIKKKLSRYKEEEIELVEAIRKQEKLMSEFNMLNTYNSAFKDKNEGLV